MQKELRSGIINFWLVVYGLSQFLARGNSCRKIFGSWWLVVIVLMFWLVVACGGSCVVLETTDLAGILRWATVKSVLPRNTFLGIKHTSTY